MRRTLIALLLLGLAGVFVSSASAAPFWVEPFAYADGGLVTVSGGNWTTHSGTTGEIMVTSQVAYANMANGYDYNRVFTPRLTTDVTYASFRVMVPAVVGTPSTNYFAHFMVQATTTFRAKVFVVPCGSTFTFAISVAASSAPPAVWPTCLAYDTWYTVVIKYDGTAAATATLWVDPATEASPSVVASDVPTPLTAALGAFALRQSNTVTPAGSVLWQYLADDINVGPTFLDVIPGVAVESSTWGHVKGLYQ